MYKTLIVEDQISSQNFMKYAIKSSNDRYTLCDIIRDADDILRYLQKEKVDLILLDIHTNKKENGLIEAEKIKQLYPNIKIIVLTFLVSQKHILRAKKIGCEGFWYKDYTDEDLLEIMDFIMQGNTFYPEDAPIVKIGMAKTTDFTKRELEVIQAKANGLSNMQVCQLLNIKERTLNDYIRNLKEKTGYTNMIQIITAVCDKHFIKPQD